MNRRALVVAEDGLQKVAERYLRFFHSLKNRPRTPGMENPVVYQKPSCYRVFAVPENSVGSGFNLEKYTSVFFWSLYERVILQDEFVRKHGDVSVIGRLPLAVAYHLFYIRGQFASASTKIQPVIVNPLSLTSDTGSRGGEDSSGGGDIRQTPSLAEARLWARQSLDEGGLWKDFDPGRERPPQDPKRRWMEVEEDGFRELSEEVQHQVDEGSLELWVVEDVKEVLEIPYHALGGLDFDGACGGESEPLWLLRSRPSRSGGPTIKALRDLEELAELVDEKLLKRKREMPVLVVDILFEKLRQTGLDIISQVRRRAGEELVLIAHTGYGSPIVSQACHHAGADFVVQKGGHAVGSHAGVTVAQPGTKGSGEDRLTSWMEVFWNILSLQAAYRFGSHALTHLSGQIKKSVSSWGSETGWLGQAWRDLESVNQPHSEVHFRESWRRNVFDLLSDSANFVNVVREADGLDAELNVWKGEIVEEAKRLAKRSQIEVSRK